MNDGSSDSVSFSCSASLASNQEFVDSYVLLSEVRSVGWKRVYFGPVGLGVVVVVDDDEVDELEEGSCSRSSRGSVVDEGDSLAEDAVSLLEDDDDALDAD